MVGSKNFTEQVLLGEILAQQIERRLGVPVERKLNLGGTLLAHEALVKGDIDLYPEYTGTALAAVLQEVHQRTPARPWLKCGRHTGSAGGWRGWRRWASTTPSP